MGVGRWHDTWLRRIQRFGFFVWVVGIGSCAEDDCNGIGSGGSSGVCCKVCTTSQACGDSCIPTGSMCKVGAGCACNGDQYLEVIDAQETVSPVDGLDESTTAE